MDWLGPLFEAFREGAVGAGRMVFEAKVLIDLKQALMVEEVAVEFFPKGRVAEEAE